MKKGKLFGLFSDPEKLWSQQIYGHKKTFVKRHVVKILGPKIDSVQNIISK